MIRRWLIRGVMLAFLWVCLGVWVYSYRYSTCIMAYHFGSYRYRSIFLENGKLYVYWVHGNERRSWYPRVERLDPYCSNVLPDAAGTHFLGFACGSSTFRFQSGGGVLFPVIHLSPPAISDESTSPILSGLGEIFWGQFKSWGFATIPFWFPIALHSLLLALVWRKTRPKPDPRSAFPVELKKDQH